MNRHLPLLITLAACAALPAHAQTIGAVEVTDTSSPNPANGLATFVTQSILGPVTSDGLAVGFTHRMAAHNTRIATGTVAQVNKRSLVFEIVFTVEDPEQQGYTLGFDSLIQNISTIQWTGGPGTTAWSTGLALDVRYDDTDNGEEDFEVLTGLFAQATDGVTVTEWGSAAVFESSTATGSLGPYTGTNRFAVRITTVTTPTTNVAFPNSATGSGSVNLGLGGVSDSYPDINPADLGHFLTVTATFNNPCPADFNADTQLNFFDFAAFIAAYEAEDPAADFNNDGQLNFFDFTVFIQAFNAGCP